MFLPSRPVERRGTATVIGLFTTIMLVGLSGAILTISLSSSREQAAAKNRHKAFFVANSGLSHAVANFSVGTYDDLGAPAAPVEFSDGGYWASVVDNGDETYTITSTGLVGRQEATIEAVIRAVSGGIFDNALFAGNSSGDLLYRLTLGGDGGEADEVNGDVYSGGNVHVWGDAAVNGMVRANGVISGGTGEANDVAQPIPDLQAPAYETTADFDVRAMFLADARYQSSVAGGMAWQLGPQSPAHIFRLNPSDRTTELNHTEKDDFFLEDPYEPMAVDRYQDGTDPYKISLAGVGNAPGPNGNDRVYYVDGNLWLHNKKAYSFQFDSPEAAGIQVTFVVKGNIYFSDNLFYDDLQRDGVAFIAMKDDAVDDSGNIYFGDPEFGTLRHMQAYMYAEDTFLDVNLDETGSTVVEVDGIMSAGNHVSIVRDFNDHHTKLQVDFDDRVSTGALELPGLPPLSGGDGPGYEILSWRELVTP